MSKAWNLVRKLGKDEEGAALIEYTVLLGILVVAVIATIVAVGGWVNGKWTALNAQLPDPGSDLAPRIKQSSALVPRVIAARASTSQG